MLHSFEKARKSKDYTYKNECRITKTSENIYTIGIAMNGKYETFNFIEDNKPVFESKETGEIVIEFSGLASDGKADCSWAVAKFKPEGFSTLHFHKERTENYYIISGSAKVLLDGEEYHLSAGDHIEIPAGKQHQVFNISSEKSMKLVVSCEPAWVYEDLHIISNAKTQEKRRSIDLK